MTRRRNRNAGILPQSVLDEFKYEVAESLGLMEQIQTKGWGEMTSRDIGRIGGKIGGNMVKAMIRRAEAQLMNGNSSL